MEKLKEIFLSMNTMTGKSLKPLTINNYIKKINKVAQIVTGKDYDGSIAWMKQPEKVISKLKESNLKSLKDYLSPIVRLLRHNEVDEDIIKRYNENMIEAKEAEDSVRKENKATKKEQENAMTLEEIQQKLDKFSIFDSSKNIDYKKLVQKLIVLLYFNNELIARNNYYNMKIANANKKNRDLNANYNYLFVEGDMPKSFVMVNYKTSGTYGIQKFPITNTELKKTLKLYLDVTNKKAGDLLFTNEKEKEIPPSTFQDMIASSMKAVLGKPINIDLVRKIHITSFYKDGLKSENEIEAFSHRLLHSKNKQTDYRKVDLFKDDREKREARTN